MVGLAKMGLLVPKRRLHLQVHCRTYRHILNQISRDDTSQSKLGKSFEIFLTCLWAAGPSCYVCTDPQGSFDRFVFRGVVALHDA